jgi:hypothetical protein
MGSPRLAILRAQAAAAAALATTQDTAYKARCAAFESGDHPLPTPPAPASDVPAPTPAPTWRRGSDIPKTERTGLWHTMATDGTVFDARPAESLAFRRPMYRAAAPGTKAGDRYDEARYAAPRSAA